ncbi:MAG: hypothetical protein IJK44_07035 [Bacteroidales bacterium]|nr:hypothetical protein [Bacteroidales bacterium]
MKRLILATAAVLCIAGCEKKYEMGTYGYDAAYFAKHNIGFVELVDGSSKVMVIPAWQGRVQTSTTDGDNGTSYGWTNYRFIDAEKVSPQFNPFGGEERFWIGPEGGPFSWYFKKGEEQVYENWKVPSYIDTDAYEVEEVSPSKVVLTKEFDAVNASDNNFRIGVRRTVALVDASELKDLLGVDIPQGLKSLAYKTENTLINKGEAAWDKKTGMPSVWLLGSFNPTPTTTVFIPCNAGFQGRKINDEYFGKVPADRLVYDDGMFFFKIDGKYRSKIGLPAGSAKDICGSYDSAQGVLNILKYTVPSGDVDYVNGQWGPQENPFGGDVINSYNDGPTETGFVQGPFYEIETSSPAAALAPGECLTHVQYTIHIQGNKEMLSAIAEQVFGVGLEKIDSVFKK